VSAARDDDLVEPFRQSVDRLIDVDSPPNARASSSLAKSVSAHVAAVMNAAGVI